MFVILTNKFLKFRLCDVTQSILSLNSLIKNILYIPRKYCHTSSTMSIFQGKADRFDGVTIDSNKETEDDGNITSKLERSLTEWVNTKKRGIWFRVNIQQSDWVPILAKNGFLFHHAKTDYVMMYKWLPKDEVSNVPPYAHTMIGVGAVVINDKDEVLVVSEKYNLLSVAQWKLPGGYIEPNENIVDAAIREVYEETNIHTEFRSFLTMRHGHGGQFGCSDIYNVVSLKPTTLDIKKCDREISDAKWMHINEYLSHPNIHELNRFFVQKYLENKQNKMKIECTHGIHEFLKKPYTLYHAVELDETNKL